MFLNKKSIWISRQICQVLHSLSALNVLKLLCWRNAYQKACFWSQVWWAWGGRLLFQMGFYARKISDHGRRQRCQGVQCHRAPWGLSLKLFPYWQSFMGWKNWIVSAVGFPVPFQLYTGSNHSVSIVILSFLGDPQLFPRGKLKGGGKRV